MQVKFVRRGESRPRVRARGRLEAPGGFDALVSVGISSGYPVAIWSSQRGQSDLSEHDEQPGFASFPKSRPSRSPAVALTAYEDGADPSAVVTLDELPVAFPHVQRFPDGAFLIAGSRCHWEPKGPESNAFIFNSNGSTEQIGTLGDGLEHVRIAPDGTIWVGYFDEGIFGNYGWGAPYGPEPLGAAGIVAWSRTFEKTWELDLDEGLVSDCYALNTGGQSIWACPYTDFPVVRLTEVRVDTWQTNDISGPRGILATANRVALIGAYSDPSLFVSGHLEDGGFVEDQRTHLEAANGEPLTEFKLHCSGSTAHFFTNDTWATFNLDDLD